MDYKVTSFDLKLALLQYFRFKRGWLSVTEFRGADIIVDTGKEIIEVETKITKSNLIDGEKRKFAKHQRLKIAKDGCPNKFLFCVPERLVETTLDWAMELNPNYGVIGFDEKNFLKQIKHFICHRTYLRYAKSAKKLHDSYNQNIRWAIAKRASSEIANTMTRIFEGKIYDYICKTDG